MDKSGHQQTSSKDIGVNKSTAGKQQENKMEDSKFSPATKETLFSLAKKLVEEGDPKSGGGHQGGQRNKNSSYHNHRLQQEDKDNNNSKLGKPASICRNGFHLDDHLTDDIKQNLGAVGGTVSSHSTTSFTPNYHNHSQPRLVPGGGGDRLVTNGQTEGNEEISGLILSFSDEEQDNIDRKSLEYGAMANARVKQGDFKGAVKLYSLAISLNDNEFRFFCNRSFCYEHLKQFKLALADADHALRLLPFRPKPHFMRGKALIGLRRYEEAEREFKLAEKMDPECKDYFEEMIKLRSLALSELGFQSEESYIAAQRHGSIQEAIDALLQESNRNNTRLNNHNNGITTLERQYHSYNNSRDANGHYCNNNGHYRHPSSIGHYGSDKFNNRKTRDRRLSLSVSRVRSKSCFRLSSPMMSTSGGGHKSFRGGGRSKNMVRSSSLDSLYGNSYSHGGSNRSKSSARFRAPINIFGYKAIWIGNVGPRCKPERLREVFTKYGRITVANIVPESFCAFVCFDNSRSPCAAIYDMYEKVVEGISNGNRCLKFRFAPGKDQDKNYHKTARRKSTDECYFWRTTGCTSGEKCKRLHLTICRGIDFQPWMSNKKSIGL